MTKISPKNTMLLILGLLVFSTSYFFISKTVLNKNDTFTSTISQSPSKAPLATKTITPVPITNTPSPKPTSTPIPTPTYEGTVIQSYVTYYGFSDNDPPGTQIAYPKSRFPEAIHDQASGIGTYDNPITLAANPSWLPIGSKVYLPYIKKYAVMEDLCASCAGSEHIDLWMESDGGYTNELNECQRSWTKSTTIVINPGRNNPVITTPLFNKTNGTCLGS